MNKKSRRANREANQQHKKEVKKARKQLRAEQKEQGTYEKQVGVSNALCPLNTVEEECTFRENAVDAQ